MIESTKISPFFANTGWGRKITTNLKQLGRGDGDNIRVHGLASRMAEIHEFAKNSMIDAQQHYQAQADKQRTTAPPFRPGDLVWFRPQTRILHDYPESLTTNAKASLRS